ncbi:MAG TPA: FAD-dependent oxidoreductase [Tissierellaceae bacterium]|nr:FAD-dependent oxidoreductase [Tissierellaceae bacterium]
MKIKKTYDSAVIGAGPAGITTSIYLARSGFDVAIIERGIYGGQLNDTDSIENYTAFESVSGMELAQKMESHSRSVDGIEHVYGDVNAVEKKDDIFKVDLGDEYIYAKSLVIATGVSHKKLEVEGEEGLVGKGISYCTTCDGAFFRGKNVTVIGGGDSAMESAIYMSKIANEVTLIHRRDEFRAEQILQDRAKEASNIKYIYNAKITSISEDDGIVSGVCYNNKKTFEKLIHPTDGIFINVGVVPNTSAFGDLGILRESGFIYTDKNMKTSVDGIFAVGDVRYDSVRQVVTATGDGAIASESVNNYLNNI